VTTSKSPTRTSTNTSSKYLDVHGRPNANFLRLITEWRIQKRVEEQFNAFLSGFNELIPPDLVNVFDERELELLIGGIADIDVEDWKKHTDYRGYTENDEVIQNFWKCIRSWDAEQKSRLLQFATGTSRIPVNGFKDLQGSDGPRRFTIEKAGEPNQLPKSHTWYVHPARVLCSSTDFNPVSTVSICRRTRRLRRSTRSSRLLSRKLLDSDKNRRVVGQRQCTKRGATERFCTPHILLLMA
jgi:hypothetical protein